MLDALTGRPGLVRLLDAAEALSGLDLRVVASRGTDAQLADTRAAQPLLYLADWAWGSAALAGGLRPAAVAGHSLGELAALAIAGVYSVEAGLELVVERSRLMAECAAANPGAMAAVLGMESDAIRAATASIEGVWVANDNSPGQVVVSGTVGGVAAAQDALLAAGARRVVPLPVAGGFHTPLMGPAAAAFRDILESTSFADANVPVYSNTDPRASVDAGELRERLATQMVSPVRWTETMVSLRADGVTALLEAGPGAVLTGLAKRTEGLACYAVEQDGISSVLTQEGV
jgi:[acyl-carrier-protein] S-malonyltransferase